MATLYGHLGFADTDRVFGSIDGQQVLYEETDRILRQFTRDVDAASALFVDETTTDHQRRYKLIGGGMQQTRGGLAQSKAVKARGYFDVAFPIEEFGDQIASDRVFEAYMTVKDLDIQVKTITRRYAARIRSKIMGRIFNNAAETFQDDLYGALTIQPLANGDQTTYPPIIGSDTEATANHYIATNFAASSVSDANDPYSLIVANLTAQFGTEQGNSRIVTFIHPDQTAKTVALAKFVDVSDNWVALGADERRAIGIPDVPGTSRVIGRHTDGTWVVEWLAGIPSGYMYGTHLDAPPPLVRRVDPADTGLGQGGLQLVLNENATGDAEYPFRQRHYAARYGYGAGNRLNGVVLQLVASTTYSTPTIYA